MDFKQVATRLDFAINCLDESQMRREISALIDDVQLEVGQEEHARVEKEESDPLVAVGLTLRELINELEVVASRTTDDTLVYMTGRDKRDSFIMRLEIQPDEVIHDEPTYIRLVPGMELI